MIDKNYIRIKSQLVKFENEGGLKDIYDTELLCHNFIFKKLIFRLIFIFLTSFTVLTLKRLPAVFFDFSLMTKDFYYGFFKDIIFFSFILVFIYAIIGSVFYYRVYKQKEKKVCAYFSTLEELEK